MAIVDHGKRIALGTPQELIAKLEATNIIEFASTPALEEATSQRSADATARRGAARMAAARRFARGRGAAAHRAVERGGAKLDTLSTHAATLEDLFVALTGRELRDA